MAALKPVVGEPESECERVLESVKLGERDDRVKDFEGIEVDPVFVEVEVFGLGGRGGLRGVAAFFGFFFRKGVSEARMHGET